MLQSIIMDTNDLTATTSLIHVPRLVTEMFIYENNLETLHLETIGTPTSLTGLYAEDNLLTEVPNVVSFSGSIEEIYLMRNRIVRVYAASFIGIYIYVCMFVSRTFLVGIYYFSFIIYNFNTDGLYLPTL